MQLIVAEKPSVARDLARVLGLPQSGRSWLEGNGRVVTWCVGHLVELEEPAAYDGRWKAWRLDTLPMIPERFELRPSQGTSDQYRVVRDLLCDSRFSEVVNACDAGREGELIFRYVYQLAGSRLPIKRLWISSLTDEAIRQGFAALKPGAHYDALADAARCRSEADWLVGMNATRAVTVRHRRGDDSALYSIGRVQTPTLAILVAREKALREFVPKAYWEVRGRFAGESGGAFHATWFHGRASRLGRAEMAASIVERAVRHCAARDPLGPIVESLRQKSVREPPPLLFDLTSLQRTANKRYGMSATRTLETAQTLYETHKVLTYPRTDSRHLSSDLAPELPRLFGSLAGLPDYAPFASQLIAHPPRVTKRVFDDARVQDHHAIIPTGKLVRLDALGTDERRIFDLVARRFLGVFYPDAEFALTEAVIRVGAPVPSPPPAGSGEDRETLLDTVPPPPDRFLAKGRVRTAAGWQAVAGIGGDDGDGGGREETPRRDEEGREAEPSQTLPPLKEGLRLNGELEALAKKTRPPPRYTEAALLGAMESAGRAIDDEALRLAMKDCGLGTPATRAATIETLLKRGFVTREKKLLVPTPTGMALIDALPVESLASPELTGAWESRLARIARREESRAAFMADIIRYVCEVVDAIRASPDLPPMSSPPASDRSFTAKPAGRKGASPARKNALSSARLPVKKTARPGGAGAGPSAPGRVAARPRSATAKSGRKPTARLPRARAPAAPAKSPGALGKLLCPRCRVGNLMAGHRGWGCTRWREGCPLVIWFELDGKRLSETELRELVTKGETRPGKWPSKDGRVREGRVILDVEARGGAARFQEDPSR